MNGVDRPPEGGREPAWSAAAWNTPDTRRRARQRVEPRLTQVNRPRLGWEAGPVEDKGPLLGPLDEVSRGRQCPLEEGDRMLQVLASQAPG